MVVFDTIIGARMSLRDQILELRSTGMSYNQITAELGCSKSTVSHHLSPGGRDRTQARTSKWRRENVLGRKVENFQAQDPGVARPVPTSDLPKRIRNKVADYQGKVPKSQRTFTAQDVYDKFGEDPVCYLTGAPLDYTEPGTYHFDHIQPRSRGGDNSLNNLGLTTKAANDMKGDRTVEELLDQCEAILRHHGRL